MLIRCSIENWMSFKDRTTFSMIASRERQHNERVPKISKYKMNVLPIAAIYGGNASGKSNFFKAMQFVKRMVVEGTRPEAPIPINRFLLDTKKADLPAHFSFTLLIENIIYEFSFAVTTNAVIEEKLVKIRGDSERILYHRKKNKRIFNQYFKEESLLGFAFKGTRENQLFLTNTVSQNVDAFKPIYDWFKHKLVLISPESFYDYLDPQYVIDNDPIFNKIGKLLYKLDTGIVDLGQERIQFDMLPFLGLFKKQFKEDLKEGSIAQIRGGPEHDHIIITKQNEEIVARKLVTYHNTHDGNSIKFNINQESDGTIRLFDLLPAFVEALDEEADNIYIIDELDRSLHTLLTRKLLLFYLSSCSPQSRSQLIFTTHDVLLMDQQLFRRDEMWFADRDDKGCSRLMSFSDYKDIRYDKDIRKSYLQGRFGGIPRILLSKGCF